MESKYIYSVQNNCIKLATCNINQWALDFDGNLKRTIESINQSKNLGCKYRLGPELEIPGYSCEDHFLEMDTFMHCDQSLAAILDSDITCDILCDIGCPILHNNVRYNCRVLCLNKKIVLIRPKVYLADDGNYREKRFFTAWDYSDLQLHDHALSDILFNVTKQRTVKMGVGIIATQETTLAFELCEELWTANSPHIGLFLSGVEVIANGSGSHHSLRKLNVRLDLMKSATSKCGGAYLYSNHRGCDGNRLYFDGSSMICVNGDMVAQASQFSLKDVEVISALVDLDAIRTYRSGQASFQEQSSRAQQLPVIDLRDFSLRPFQQVDISSIDQTPSPKIETHYHTPEEECAYGPACWLWDYLRRSGAQGYLLPLSGGADSGSVMAIVRIMCLLAAQAYCEGDPQVQNDVTRLFSSAVNFDQEVFNKKYVLTGTEARILTSNANAEEFLVIKRTKKKKKNNSKISADVDTTVEYNLKDPKVKYSLNDPKVKKLADAINNTVMHSIYLGTKNSSFNTRDRAERLAKTCNAYHTTVFIDVAVTAMLQILSFITTSKKNESELPPKSPPKFLSEGGTYQEDVALQNIQARLRMVTAYLCAQLFPWMRGYKGYLLVLSSANVDEALRGYMTKYDCSSADVNPIGGLCKGDLKRMLLWASTQFDLPELKEIADAKPTAELRPIVNGDGSDSNQLDEDDMGMTYAELGVFGSLRKIYRCGPVKMFLRLLEMWNRMEPVDVAAKVKRFFYYYSVNRHKLTVLTPSYHAESYSPDDNRFDLRQFLYNTKWTRQFKTIDTIVENSKASGRGDDA
eukprot:gene9692-13045_t